METKQGMIIDGIFHEAVKDGYTDCPEYCSIINKCNEAKNGAPCLLFGENIHFEKREENPEMIQKNKSPLCKQA